MVHISVIGHFGEGKTLLNGQTIKTKAVTKELEAHFGNNQILKIDTHGGIKTLLKAPFHIFHALKNSKHILMFPAHNGLRVYGPLLQLFRAFFKGRKLHYVVIGGWLPNFLIGKRCLKNALLRFDALYVETNTMKIALEQQGFRNVFVLPNFKQLPIVSKEELSFTNEKPYKICTFSRVMKEKGIEEIVNVVKTINSKLGITAYALDIYGQIEASQTEWFENFKVDFPPYVKYCGRVDASESVSVLKDYFALIFPTKFYTEGIPGTIIDAYAAGIPVISAKWQSFHDIVEDGVTGIGYEFNNTSQLCDILDGLCLDPMPLLNMKNNCIMKALDYLPSKAIQILIQQLD